MRGGRSVAYLPSAEWAGELRRRALLEPPVHDLSALLDDFGAHSDYYLKRINGVKSWSAVPPLEKADVVEISVRSATPVKAARTSGTSGYQIEIWNNGWEREFRRALLYRPHLFYELPNDVTQIVFVDGDDCARPGDTPKYFEYGGLCYRTWFVGVGAEPGDALNLLTALKPQLIRGISSGIVRFIESCGVSLRHLGVRYVAPGGEYLRPAWRTTMADAFGAIVLDRYGSTESGALAWQCPHCTRYHANVDEIVIEDDADGLLATPLFVSSQPLLRYRLGDRIRFDAEPSSCEIRLPTITIEEARRDDWIIDGDGRKVSPLRFRFEQVPHLTAWRLHQRADGSLQLFYDSERPEDIRAQLLRELTQAIPGRQVMFETGIWRLSSHGKFKRVSSDYSDSVVEEPVESS